MRVVIAGNQTVRTGELLRALDLPADVVATSEEWGYAKPSAEFFERVLEASGAPARDTVYVGDHPANDTFPPPGPGCAPHTSAAAHGDTYGAVTTKSTRLRTG